MDIISEAGGFGWLSLGVFLVGLIGAIRARGEALRIAAPLSVMILALGQFGAGVGQRLVARAAAEHAMLGDRLEVLSLGTKEAQANALLSGGLVLVLLAVAGLTARLSGEPR